jgi:hypothetical protein
MRSELQLGNNYDARACRMPRTYGTVLVGLLLVAMMQAKPQAKEITARVDAQGSLPPLPQLYTCVRELTGKAYDEANAKSCLNTILASGYFQNGHIEATSGSSNVVIVHFLLTAPSLLVKGLNFDVERSLKGPMLAWIQNTGDIVTVGDVYRENHDIKTREVLGFYFRDIGKSVGITRLANLDYHAGTAGLTYHITVGPDIIPTRALPPYEDECQQPIATFNLSDVDDYVPINLVEKMTKTHGFDCFSATKIADDGRALQDSKLFNTARYEVQGDPDNRQVYLHIQGKPLKIKEIKIVGYGLLSHQSLANESALPLRSGDPYKRSLADATERYLKNKYAGANQNVEITEDDQLTSDNGLIVTFNVLTYEQDRVTINGKEFTVPPVVITVHS